MKDVFAEHVTLRSNPLEALCLLAAAGLVAFLVLSRMPPDVSASSSVGTMRWIVGLGIAGAGTFAAAGSLRKLSLDPDGFIEESLFTSRRVAWRDCSAFEVVAMGRRVQLLLVRTVTTAGEVRLRSRYGRRLGDLAELMNAFRRRALDLSAGPCG